MTPESLTPQQNTDEAPGLPRRLAAIFYDSWLVLAALMLTVALIIKLRMAVEGIDSFALGDRAISGYWRIPTFLAMLLVTFHFYAYFWIKNGQTLGMQAWRIRLVNAENRNISLRQAYIRLLAAMLSIGCLGAGYLYMFFNREKLSLHDKLSGTHLMLVPKNSA